MPDLPPTPEDAKLLEQAQNAFTYMRYRKTTRPYRRTWRGIITRKEAERLMLTVMKERALAKLRERENQA